MTSPSLKYEHFHGNVLIAENDRPFAGIKSTGARVSTFNADMAGASRRGVQAHLHLQIRTERLGQGTGDRATGDGYDIH